MYSGPIRREHGQAGLFDQPLDKVLFQLRISTEEFHRWRMAGWVSEDIEKLDRLTDDHVHEIEFVRDVLRSGIPESVADDLLGELRRPYRFNPSTMAYSFKYGWVEPLREDPEPLDVDGLLDQVLELVSDMDDEDEINDVTKDVEALRERIGELV